MSDPALHDLACAAGLQVQWEDAAGAPKTVAPDSLRAILTAMGVACGTRDDVAESRRRLAQDDRRAGASFLTATAGDWVDLDLPERGAIRLTLETGAKSEPRTSAVGSSRRMRAPSEPGYHRLDAGDTTLTLAVAPPRGFTMADAAPERRAWGVAAQLYSLRGRRVEPFGEFGALADWARALGRRGADALAISPIHALFAADPGRFGPYAPSTRLFLNVLFADPSVLEPDAPHGERGGDLIDWPQAGLAKIKRLRALFDRFEAAGSQVERDDLERFRREGGEDLERHARFEALHARFHEESGARGWQDWPAAFHDADSAGVAAFAREAAGEIDFHVFLQWLAARGLQRAQAEAKAAGMAVGLIADLAVGMDGGGSHAWSRPDDLLTGLSVGAPPDLFQPAGQDWGLAAFSPRALRKSGYAPFLATLRAAMRHTGGVRIDHAMGLRRLWLTPHGASPAEGAYLDYPLQDMLRLIALESVRTRAIVVGEDLGTVPPGFREASTAAGMAGMRVLWFERDKAGFTPPQAWSEDAMAMTGTHDLPTVAGWWRERDIDWMEKLERKGGHADVASERGARARDRERLWRACETAGVAHGPQPSPGEPAVVVAAAVDYVARSACRLAMVPLEDILGLVEQPNLPGTLDEHPNWRRRLAASPDPLLAEPSVAARLDVLRQERPRSDPEP